MLTVCLKINVVKPETLLTSYWQLLRNEMESLFLVFKDFLIPLVRAGQQLQVLVKLLDLCAFVATKDHTYEGFLPCWSGFSGNCPWYASPLTFSKRSIEAMILSRDSYYKKMQEKLENLSVKLNSIITLISFLCLVCSMQCISNLFSFWSMFVYIGCLCVPRLI